MGSKMGKERKKMAGEEKWMLVSKRTTGWCFDFPYEVFVVGCLDCANNLVFVFQQKW